MKSFDAISDLSLSRTLKKCSVILSEGERKPYFSVNALIEPQPNDLLGLPAGRKIYGSISS